MGTRSARATHRTTLDLHHFMRTSMNRVAYAAAKEKQMAAKRKLYAMQGAKTVFQLSLAWSEFLTEANRVFTRILRATADDPAEKKWFKALNKLRHEDELLRYVENARHADEHGIERITRVTREGMAFAARDPNKVGHMNIEAGPFGIRGEVSNTRLVRIPGEVELLPIKVRGVTYHLPTMHLGKPFTATHPVAIAQAACDHLDGVLADMAVAFGKIG